MSEKYRPKLHFSPARGWMNDPNGMIHIDGVYHLFFQHDPDSTLHRTMHWGHASSTDLTSWTHHPIALYPDEEGTCFSGSAIETPEGEVKLFYTAHQRSAEGEDYQRQMLVHANRALDHFERGASNPVVPNPGLTCFRDPKVVWHEPSQRWIMVLTHGQSMGFYGSTDLVSWELLSTFGEGQGKHGPGPWECPDMVQLTAPDGRKLWVLIVSIGADAMGPGTGVQYFIGDFDGREFINANPVETVLWLDSGRDHYATQTFFDRSGGAPIAMSWSGNGIYAQQTPTEAFRGVMTLPREMHLVETVDGLRVVARVPAQALAAFPAEMQDGVGHITQRYDLAVGEAADLTLFGEAQAQYTISRTAQDRGTIRTQRGEREGMRKYEHDYLVDVIWPEGGLDLTLFLDRGFVEISAAGGQTWITNLFYPEDTNIAPMQSAARKAAA